MASDAPGGSSRTYAVQLDDAGRRLDRVLRKLLRRASLAEIYTGLRKGEARIDGRLEAPQYRVRIGETLSVSGGLLAALSRRAEPDSGDGGLDVAPLVLHLDRDFVVFSKPRGLPVHGERSLASAAADLLARNSRHSISFRPGPVHRLDRDTSGLVFFALTLQGARELSRLLRERACRKVYLALLEGSLAERQEWKDALARDEERRLTVAGGEGERDAEAHVEPLLRSAGLTLARVLLLSGRTHQIRAQASIHGHPLDGDTRYGGRANPAGYLLHAALFSFPAGSLASEQTSFSCPLPPESRMRLEGIFGRPALESALAALPGVL